MRPYTLLVIGLCIFALVRADVEAVEDSANLEGVEEPQFRFGFGLIGKIKDAISNLFKGKPAEPPAETTEAPAQPSGQGQGQSGQGQSGQGQSGQGQSGQGQAGQGQSGQGQSGQGQSGQGQAGQGQSPGRGQGGRGTQPRRPSG